MAGRFPLYTDADIRGSLIEALRRKGGDVLRAIDAHSERTRDPVHFETAARLGRVLASYDVDQVKIALEWIETGRAFRGLVTWPQRRHLEWSEADIVGAFEVLAAEEDPFPAGYPIRYLKP